MSLRLADRWLWDFWIVRDRSTYHLFFLQAPRALGDPELRHWNASVGHAVSTDLRTWDLLSDALRPGPAGSWDDYTTWTGSTIRDGDRWVMLYTGTSHAEKGLVQRIGLAESNDLVEWRRHSANPVLEADPRRYETLDLELWHEEAWRDPWFHRDGDSTLYALLTARARVGPPGGRGVIGLARATSPDRWEVLDPIVGPAGHGHLEIPQLLRMGDRWCLLFSAPPLGDGTGRLDPGDPRRFGGTHFLLAHEPLGPFDWETQGVLLADRAETWYGAKLIEGPDGRLVCLAWLNRDSEGRFLGELSDPMNVEVDAVTGPRIIQDP